MILLQALLLDFIDNLFIIQIPLKLAKDQKCKCAEEVSNWFCCNKKVLFTFCPRGPTPLSCAPSCVLPSPRTWQLCGPSRPCDGDRTSPPHHGTSSCDHRDRCRTQSACLCRAFRGRLYRSDAYSCTPCLPCVRGCYGGGRGAPHPHPYCVCGHGDSPLPPGHLIHPGKI